MLWISLHVRARLQLFYVIIHNKDKPNFFDTCKIRNQCSNYQKLALGLMSPPYLHSNLIEIFLAPKNKGFFSKQGYLNKF